MSEVSKMVRNRIKGLYAILATTAAQKAVDAITAHDDAGLAGSWADATERFLIKAGADAARWVYKEPRIKP